MLLRPNVSVFRRIVAAMALSVLVGVTVTAQHTPAWAAQYDVIETIPVGDDPFYVAVSPDGLTAYVTNQADATVSVIDTDPLSAGFNTVIDTIAGVDGTPRGLAVSPDGLRVYVAGYNNPGTVSFIDRDPTSAGFNTVTDTIAVGTAPNSVVFTPDGTTAYASNQGTDDVSVIDTGTKAIKQVGGVPVPNIAVGDTPGGMAVSPDGTTLYVTNWDDADVSVIDTATNATKQVGGVAVPDIAVGNGASAVAVSPDGLLIYVTAFSSDDIRVIDTSSYAVTKTISLGDGPRSVSISPDGTAAYVAIFRDDNVKVIELPVTARASASADAGVPGIFLTVAGPVGRSASEAPIYYGANRVSVTSTYLLTVTGVSNITPTITTLAEGTIDADGSFSSMTRLPVLAPGVYNVQMVGTHVNGSTLQLTSQITIGGVGEFTSIGANIPVIK
jgi:YVTN family beta-propeller protein